MGSVMACRVPRAGARDVRGEDGTIIARMSGMDQSPLRTLLIAAGILLVIAGLAWPWLSRYLGRLSGDVVVRRENFTFVFPIVTCLVVSVVLTLLFWLFGRR